MAETYGIIVYQEEQIIQILSRLAGYTPGEGRSGAPRHQQKKASEIEKRKQLFIEGCKKNNDASPKDGTGHLCRTSSSLPLPSTKATPPTAVITVQTAYLRRTIGRIHGCAAAARPAFDKTEKIVNFIQECRRMGVDVLPPDVNYSGLDFEIKALPADTPSSAIRNQRADLCSPCPKAAPSAISAVQNVGVGPVQTILQARTSAAPSTAWRTSATVDLRQVNKRAGMLIKVGAFDRFGRRSQLCRYSTRSSPSPPSVHSARDSDDVHVRPDQRRRHSRRGRPISLPDVEDETSRERYGGKNFSASTP